MGASRSEAYGFLFLRAPRPESESDRRSLEIEAESPKRLETRPPSKRDGSHQKDDRPGVTPTEFTARESSRPPRPVRESDGREESRGPEGNITYSRAMGFERVS